MSFKVLRNGELLTGFSVQEDARRRDILVGEVLANHSHAFSGLVESVMDVRFSPVKKTLLDRVDWMSEYAVHVVPLPPPYSGYGKAVCVVVPVDVSGYGNVDLIVSNNMTHSQVQRLLADELSALGFQLTRFNGGSPSTLTVHFVEKYSATAERRNERRSSSNDDYRLERIERKLDDIMDILRRRLD